INNHDYSSAYQLWARDGAASGQTLQQFEAGYQGTAGVSLLINAVRSSEPGAEADVTVLAVTTPPGNPTGQQRAQRFDGAYVLATDGGSYHLAAARILETLAQTPVDLTSPLVVLQSYYAAIESGSFATAYTYWDQGGPGMGQSFSEFRAGFAHVVAVAIRTGESRQGAAAGSIYTSIPTAVVATRDDGSTRAFCGSYDLRRANIQPFDVLGWRLYSANIAEVPGFDPASANLQSLLDGC
ncbi:MAG TPA: hypothetical protein VFY90_07585, partial [Tepidiformaceae bacterium]|nr:hypothetical protein [Tepidiformaceae bacterium]